MGFTLATYAAGIRDQDSGQVDMRLPAYPHPLNPNPLSLFAPIDSISILASYNLKPKSPLL